MGIQATYNYQGVSIPNLYFKIVNMSWAAPNYVATVWVWKDRATSLSNTTTPAFVVTTKAAYVIGADPFVLLYVALKLEPLLSGISDVLEI